MQDALLSQIRRNAQRALNGMIAAWQSITAVYFRDRNEIWGTASVALTFSLKTAPADRDFATYERCKQVFKAASGLSLEELVSKVTAEPVKHTDIDFDFHD